MSEKKSRTNGEKLTPLLIWVTKTIVILYVVIIISGIVLRATFDKGIEASILASVSALMTTALGGLIAYVIRNKLS